jgi:nucleoside-diphosphate-sugar epimerase
MSENKKYLFVTGGSGFIGKNFICKAVKTNYKIFALSRKKRKNTKNIFWVKGEINGNFKKYLKKSDIMIHFAASGVNQTFLNSNDLFKENVLKPYQFLINCCNYGPKKWIIIGSASEYGKAAEKKKILNVNTSELPESNYEISKLMFSKLAMELSRYNRIKCRVLRIFNVYGKGENKKRLFPSVRRAVKLKKKFTIFSSSQIKDFIEINKVTDMITDTLNFKKNSSKFPQIWHIASGKPKTVKNFILSNFNKNFIKKLIFKNSPSVMKRNFISSKSSIWKI